MYHDAFQIIHILDIKRSTASTLGKQRKTVKFSNKSNIKTKQMLYNLLLKFILFLFCLIFSDTTCIIIVTPNDNFSFYFICLLMIEM